MREGMNGMDKKCVWKDTQEPVNWLYLEEELCMMYSPFWVVFFFFIYGTELPINKTVNKLKPWNKKTNETSL